MFTLQDRADIEDLLGRYCMALDTKNWDEFLYIVTDDVAWDYSDEFGTIHHGRDEVVNAIRTSLEPHPACMHAPLMTRIWPTGPDTAEGFSHVLSKSVLDGASLPATAATTFEVYCTWLDHYVRTSAGWRIQKRTLRVMASSGSAEPWDPATPAGQAFRRLTGPLASDHGAVGTAQAAPHPLSLPSQSNDDRYVARGGGVHDRGETVTLVEGQRSFDH